MKLWQQGLVLLGVPLICQVVFAGLLMQSLLKLENAAREQVKAKDIVTSCQSVNTLAARYLIFSAGNRFLLHDEMVVSKEQLLKEITANLNLISNLTHDSDDAIFANYTKHVKEFLIFGNYASPKLYDERPTVALARFLDEREYMEEAMLLVAKILKDEDRIKAKLGPIASELEPQSASRRQSTITLISLGVLANLFVIAGLALWLGRRTLRRLSLLMNNIHLFGKGQETLSDIGGTDELAELDKTFRDMAEARRSAEEFKNTLMEMVAHDLRSPLASNSLTLSMILREDASSLSGQNLRRIRRLDSEMHRLAKLADGLLDVGTLQSGRLKLHQENHQFDKLVTAAVHAVRGMADVRDIRFDTEYDINQQIHCDDERIIQVLINLLSNAIKFSPQESSIIIRATEIPSRRVVRISIEDSGPGIDPDQKANLFNRFSQLDQPMELKRTGRGLGLFITELLVRTHNGTVDCETIEGGGTRFWFELPHSQESGIPIKSADTN